MEAPELKPCPFCGEADQETIMVEHMPGTTRRPAYRVLCDNCGASTGYTDRGDHIAAWNTRAPDPDLDAHIGAALAEAAEACAYIIKNYDVMDASGTKYAPLKTQKAAKGMVSLARTDILALHPAALTALDRAIEAAVNEALERAAREAENGWLYQYETAPDRIRALIEAERGKP